MTQVPTNSVIAVIALTAERAATMSWYDEMVAAGRSKSLMTGNVRCGVAAVHEVLRSLALETPVNCHSELMEDSLRNIEPVQLLRSMTNSDRLYCF